MSPVRRARLRVTLAVPAVIALCVAALLVEQHPTGALVGILIATILIGVVFVLDPVGDLTRTPRDRW